jgi:hypothetical protein
MFLRAGSLGKVGLMRMGDPGSLVEMRAAVDCAVDLLEGEMLLVLTEVDDMAYHLSFSSAGGAWLVRSNYPYTLYKLELRAKTVMKFEEIDATTIRRWNWSCSW